MFCTKMEINSLNQNSLFAYIIKNEGHVVFESYKAKIIITIYTLNAILILWKTEFKWSIDNLSVLTILLVK